MAERCPPMVGIKPGFYHKAQPDGVYGFYEGGLLGFYGFYVVFFKLDFFFIKFRHLRNKH